MSWSPIRHLCALSGAALLLTVLTYPGQVAHPDHHPLLIGHAGRAELSLVDHVAPIDGPHLESLAGTRRLACPGCLAQLQVGGSHLLAPHGLDRPDGTEPVERISIGRFASRRITGSSPRAPPFR